MYEIGADSITVIFGDGATYLYTYASTGQDKIEHMKALAESGKDLNTFINKKVRKAYALKLR